MLFFVGSCTSISPTSTLPTLIPTEHLPTVIAQTVQAMVPLSGSTTPELLVTNSTISEPSSQVEETATEVINTPAQQVGAPGEFTATPRETLTPQPPVEIPFADIQFISPGELSRVISPLELYVFLVPGDSGRARVELFGEDGRLMYRKLFVFGSPSGLQTNLRDEIDFEIKGVAETARLVISVDDAYGRVKGLASEELILLSMGDSDLNPPGDFLEPIVIQEPEPKVLIQGGSLAVTGLVRTSSEQPLLVELITTDGKVIGNRLAGIAPEPANGHRLFAAEVPYAVYSPTWVRVTVSEWTNKLGGPAQLSSLDVLLGP